ncbi:long-chain fatty acid--CoA ligase [Streptomyces sp. ISL-11]|uniref:AMP-dependent synthetase/ligase n=1 Tax=Streptomyces sp. ISL-11 TaxID=2819174 RepID=UPI001BE82CEB|nr:long-chain fatty acid--CoA ligase [Streptomyces sp. ISL-11]MBT2387228.1 long-chain fatty acid--CoA ligase [Streptomyces sp. ISL-11]
MRQRPRTLAVLAEWAAERHGTSTALRFRSPGGGWEETGYEALRASVRDIGRGLLALGVRPGDRVAILAETRPEWTRAYLAVLAAGGVVVPVYPTAGQDELLWVLGDSGARVVVCEDAGQSDRVAAVRAKLPELRHVVLMEGGGDGALVLDALPGRAPLAELLARADARTGDDVCSIVYTSGTTGPPKGCLLTHGNFSAVDDATADLLGGGPDDSSFLYLPLAHLFAQLVQLSTLVQGGRLCYFGGRIENVVAELAEVRPTYLPSVPRLFEKVHAGVLALAESRGPDGRARFDAAIRTGLEVAGLRDRGGEPGGELLAAWREAEEDLFSLVRAAFGGRLRLALTGAAPIAPQTLDFLRACGIAVFEGYGMTESTGVISLNHPGAVRPGTVGRPVGCEVRIAEDGEVLVRGPGVFPGYHADPAATAEVLEADGWLRTGDLGSLDADGFLALTGRKKDLIITSGGKNLAPSPVEFALQQSRWISRAVLVGDRRPYPVALLTLDAEEIAGWARREGVEPGTRPGRHPAVRALCQEAVDAANRQVSRPARIRGFAVLDGDFTVADGALTPTLKLRRAAIARRYAREIDDLYEALREEKIHEQAIHETDAV